MSCTAFVTGPAVLTRPTASLTTSSFTSSAAKPAAVVAKRQSAATVRMVVDKPEDKSIPQGFTLFSEKLNGRMAMLGFVAALGAEILSPAHPTVVEQVGSIFTTISNIL
jgi:hypothetical protein